jgi:hypothetical protein
LTNTKEVEEGKRVCYADDDDDECRRVEEKRRKDSLAESKLGRMGSPPTAARLRQPHINPLAA